MIVLDTETTGLDNDAEIVEIAIIDSWGTPLLNTLVKPKTPITPEVTAINGITNEMLKDAPCWEVIRPLVKTIFEDNCFDLPQDKSEFHKAYAYNAKFDQRMLIQSGWEGKPPEIICAMERAIHHLKIDHPHFSLINAAKALGISFDGLTPHRAASDCAVTLDILRVMRGLNPIATGDEAHIFNERLIEFNNKKND